MDTKICINPACGNILRDQDIYCGQCGSEQPRHFSSTVASVSATAGSTLDVPAPDQAAPSPLAQRTPIEAIPVSEKTAAEIPAISAITPFTPSPDLVGRSCPICLTDLYPADSYKREMVVVCPDCHTYHHQICWEINLGCSTYGCKWTPSAEVQSNRTTLSPSDENSTENPYQNRVVSRHPPKGRGMAFLANLELVCGLVPFLVPFGLLLGVGVLAFGRRGLQELSPSHRMRFWVGLIAGCVIMLLFLFAGMIYLAFENLGTG